MIQIIKKEYKELDKAIRDINKLAIQYDYFKDYNIITSPINSNYIVLLKYDVPKNYNCISTLDLAKIKAKGSFHVLKFNYMIEFLDKKLEEQSWSKYIECKVYNDKLIEIFVNFGMKDFGNIVKFNYIDDGIFKNKYIKVCLNEFKFCSYLGSEVCKERNTFICENIDYKVIYDHIINVYFQRGYLLNTDGLEHFKKTLKMVCNLINERNLNSSIS
ncbi:hypothetical protein CHF27_013475 [Romboutsia maritimum]|uniref:Uncharacterized protein n=1 Tax=Romboutsia maritimum TaxID=2020948 RepID=A0A371IPN6_9FIRM|nr:hypothetical protein [Romboutsia maritimum]RDY22432.1 hypothetical protein CHF27_013475 [Romboutsia maritimum]